jgi:hypothetical protein
MKLINFCIAALLLPLTSNGGDKVGNGGGAWVCRATTQEIQKLVLVDFYEAEEEFGYFLKSLNGSWESQVNAVLNNLSTVNAPMANALKTKIANFKSSIRFTNADLTTIEDSLYRIIPPARTCVAGKWEYTQFANFTELGHILIAKELWDHALTTNTIRAGLILHEAVYSWMRDLYQDTNSVRTRWIVGILFGEMTALEMSEELDKVFKKVPMPTETFSCSIIDQHNARIFHHESEHQLEAETNALQACIDADNGNSTFCHETNLKCEANSVKNSWFCKTKNFHEGKVTSAKSTSQVKASFLSIAECLKKSSMGGFCLMPTDTTCEPIH